MGKLFIHLGIFISILFVPGQYGFSQPYAVGSRQIDFTDPVRNRSIPTRVFYPGTLTGNDVEFAEGTFPLIVLGHGFAMNYQAYSNFRDSLVPKGFILVIPTTETGPFPFPDHQAFGADLRFLNTHIKAQSNVFGSVFYSHIKQKSAIMGHSMGGGAGVLASATNDQVNTLVLFAPAETNPSAIEAADSVFATALVFSGENDGVTSPEEMHLPIFNQLSTECKYFINIFGGGHCYFANPNLACDFGEGVSNPRPTITRAKQQEIVFRILIPWLDFHLKELPEGFSDFMELMIQNNEFSFLGQCEPLRINEPAGSERGAFPNPTEGKFRFRVPDFWIREDIEIQILDVYGRIVLKESMNSNEVEKDISWLDSGIYIFSIHDGLNRFTQKIHLKK